MITVIGSRGFIGSRLIADLRADGVSCQALDWPVTGGNHFGTVVWCRGVTSFDHEPAAVVRTHVTDLLDVLATNEVDRVVYLSSIALYRLSSSPAHEDEPIRLDPASAGEAYALAKATAEAALTAWSGTSVLLRLVKVVGAPPGRGDFLDQLLSAAVTGRTMALHTSLSSAKDYVYVDDVLKAIRRAATVERTRTFNVGTGRNVSNAEIIEALREWTPCPVEVQPDAPEVVYAEPSVERMQRELQLRPTGLVERLPDLVDVYRATLDGIL